MARNLFPFVFFIASGHMHTIDFGNVVLLFSLLEGFLILRAMANVFLRNKLPQLVQYVFGSCDLPFVPVMLLPGTTESARYGKKGSVKEHWSN